ncbi:hypothetical protein HD806DRAFT_515680 [Xylariaceae sp. AK1471]|nr:hypothetical protein HD806DRAFT_515680 [Xylariaceae sp. AK1471]
MFDYTRLAAVHYGYQGKQFIRVYYQDGGLVKESCYDDANGWYTTTNDVVAKEAKEGSPVAVTTLNEGKQTSVYFLNKTNQIRQRVRITQTPGESGQWKDGDDFPVKYVLAESQLAAVRSDENNATIRVFFQLEDKTIRGIKYDGYDAKWYDSDILINDACPGSSLSTVAGGSGEVRLFYQGSDGKVKEQYSTPDYPWASTRLKDKNFILPLRASISALAWNFDNPKSLQIRLFSITADNELVQMIYEKNRGGWRNVITKSGEVVIANSEKSSAVAAIVIDDSGTIYAFYQPQPNIIAEYSFKDGARIPLGIPTSRDEQITLESKTEEGGSCTEVPDGVISHLQGTISELVAKLADCNLQKNDLAAELKRCQDTKAGADGQTNVNAISAEVPPRIVEMAAKVGHWHQANAVCADIRLKGVDQWNANWGTAERRATYWLNLESEQYDGWPKIHQEFLGYLPESWRGYASSFLFRYR